MTVANKNVQKSKISSLSEQRVTNIYNRLSFGLQQVTCDYSSSDRAYSMILLGDGYGGSYSVTRLASLKNSGVKKIIFLPFMLLDMV